MQEYDPTKQEHPADSKQYNNVRPYVSRYRGFKVGKLFQLWPDYPEQIVRYGKYYLKWITVEEEYGRSSWNRKKRRIGRAKISIDGKTWLDYEEVAREHYGRGTPPPKPDWWDKEELTKEINAKVAEFKRVRNRMLAQKRKEALRKEAEEKGVDFDEYQKAKSEAGKKKRADQKRRRTGEKLAKQLNRKMKIAMALKDLRDSIDELQTKLEDETIDLKLNYVDIGIDKIAVARRVIRGFGRERE